MMANNAHYVPGRTPVPVRTTGSSTMFQTKRRATFNVVLIIDPIGDGREHRQKKTRNGRNRPSSCGISGRLRDMMSQQINERWGKGLNKSAI